MKVSPLAKADSPVRMQKECFAVSDINLSLTLEMVVCAKVEAIYIYWLPIPDLNSYNLRFAYLFKLFSFEMVFNEHNIYEYF